MRAHEVEYPAAGDPDLAHRFQRLLAPVRADARLFDRLAVMPVRLRYGSEQPAALAEPAEPPPDTPDSREAALDRALAETFPASDPVSSQVPTTVVR